MFDWGTQMLNTQIWLFGPSTPKMIIFKNIFFHQKRLTHTLPTSPQWLSDDHFSLRYGHNRFFGAQKCLRAKYGYLGPDALKMIIFKNIFFTRSALPIWFQKTLNDYQMIIFHQDMVKTVFLMSIFMLHCKLLLLWVKR